LFLLIEGTDAPLVNHPARRNVSAPWYLIVNDKQLAQEILGIGRLENLAFQLSSKNEARSPPFLRHQSSFQEPDTKGWRRASQNRSADSDGKLLVVRVP